jgi:DNA-binding transcriptional MerR regulator
MTSNGTEIPIFDDGKAPDALRTIGEVAKALKIRQHVLRYWEEQFPTLNPVKRSGGRRYYRPEDVALIATIDKLVHREGYTLRGARKALQGNKVNPAQKVEPASQPATSVPARPAQLSMFGDEVQAVLTEVRAIRASLAAALAAA